MPFASHRFGSQKQAAGSRPEVAELEGKLSDGMSGEGGEAPGIHAAPGVRLDDILAGLSEALVVVDRDWRVVYVNEAAERSAGIKQGTKHGIKAEDLIGKSFWEEWPDAQSGESEERLRTVMKTRVPMQFEHRRSGEQGARLEVHAFACEAGLAIQYRDITDRKNAEEARAALAAIVESSDDAIISKDLNGIILSWNRGAERLFGYKAEEIIGKPISTLAVPERVDEIPNILDRLRRGERIDHYETKRRAKDGRIVKVSITVSPIRDSSGAIIGASKVARDITDQRTAEELETRLAGIIESSDDAIISKDLNGTIQSWNGGAERIFGYKAEEIIGKPISTLAVPDRVDEIPNILESLKRGERIDHYQTKRRTKDGRVLTLSLTVSPIKDSSGRVIGASKVARDITEREQSQEALRGANEALRRANADLEQFSYAAAHDLQEPLRMVAIYSQMLKRKYAGQLDEQADEFIGYCVDGARRMEMLVRDLLAYTRATSSCDEAPPLVDLNKVVAQATGNLQIAMRESGALVVYEALPEVRAHGTLMQQLLQNLISNALKYRSEEPPLVKVSAVRQDREWLISVSDNGIGIPAEFKVHIFGLFKRLHNSAQYAGTGLGLAICQRIVERYGGKIWVESEGGKGSTFFFTLPD